MADPVTIGSLDNRLLSLILEKVEDKNACRLVSKLWQSQIDLTIKKITFTVEEEEESSSDSQSEEEQPGDEDQPEQDIQVEKCVFILQRLQKWPNVTEVGLNFPYLVDADPIISALVSAEHKALKKLKSSRLVISPESTEMLAKSRLPSQLDFLDFSSCTFDQDTLKALASVEWNLKVLRMRQCQFWDALARQGRTHFGIYMPRFFSKCPRLEIFALDCQNIACEFTGLDLAAADLEAIMQVKSSVLEEFYFTNCELGCTAAEIIYRKAKNWPALRLLNIQGCHMLNRGVLILSKVELPNLEELNISYLSYQDDYSWPEFSGYHEKTILALRTALESKWPRLKILRVNRGSFLEENCHILLNGNIPFKHLQEINPNDEASTPELISAFATAATEGRLPAYRALHLDINKENIKETAELLSSPWPVLETLQLSVASYNLGSVSMRDEALFAESISPGKYPALKELSFNSRNFSPDFVFEVLFSKPWLKLEKLSIKSYLWEHLDVFLEARLDHFPNLKTLELSSSSRPRQDLKKIGAAYWPSLETVTFYLVSFWESEEDEYEGVGKKLIYDYKTKVIEKITYSKDVPYPTIF